MAVLLEDHTSPTFINTCDDPVEYMPVAVSCNVRPATMLSDAGVTVIDRNVAACTVNTVFPDTPFNIPVSVAFPADTAVANPDAFIVATAGLLDVHVTPVNVWVVPSAYVPIAIICCVKPLAIAGAVGVSAMDCSAAAETATGVLPDTPFNVAITIVLPKETPVSVPEALIPATAGTDELQLTVVLMSCVVPSEKMPEADMVCVWPL